MLSFLVFFVGASFSVASWKSVWDLTCLKMSLFCLHTRLMAGDRILGWKYFSSEFQRHCTDVLHVPVWLLRSLKAFWFLIFCTWPILNILFCPRWCEISGYALVWGHFSTTQPLGGSFESGSSCGSFLGRFFKLFFWELLPLCFLFLKPLCFRILDWLSGLL